MATNGSVNQAGLALRADIEDRTDRLTEICCRHLGETGVHSFLDAVESIGPRLVARIDETAGPNWMPATRDRLT